MRPRIVGRATAYTSPWLDVESLDVDLGSPRGVETFYTVKTHRYVVVLAVTDDGRVPLVRQYRPAVDEHVLELPSGHIDKGESPEEAARRELREETGCDAGELVPLGEFFSEPARLNARPAAFFAPSVRIASDRPANEEAIEIVFVTPAELRAQVLSGTFRMASHLGLIGTAQLRGLMSL